jgi:hypothetical protein
VADWENPKGISEVILNSVEQRLYSERVSRLESVVEEKRVTSSNSEFDSQ